MNNRIMKIKNLVLVFGALLFINVGCVDLEETPKDFTGPSNFYNSPGHPSAMVPGSQICGGVELSSSAALKLHIISGP